MKIRLRMVAACILLSMLFGLAPSARAAAPTDLDAQVDELFAKWKAVGASVVVARQGQVAYARDWGYRNLTKKLPVDEKTYFKLSSITKMVTGIGALQLMEAGKLDLDADISRYFGYDIVNPHFKKTALTPRQLMTHTSSLSEGGGFSNIHNTVADMLSRKANKPGNFNKTQPGSEYMYSNFGAGLIGAIIEKLSGQSVQAYMQPQVFGPLGIQAAYSASLLPNPEDVSSQYADGKLNRAAQKYVREKYEDFADPERHYRLTAGSLWITSRDMAKIAIALCGDGTYQGQRLLGEDTLALMRSDQKTLGKSVSGDSPYGLFLERNTFILPGQTVYGHQGMSQGAILNVYFEPQSQFVFVLLTNGSSMQRDHRVGLLALQLFRLLYPML